MGTAEYLSPCLPAAGATTTIGLMEEIVFVLLPPVHWKPHLNPQASGPQGLARQIPARTTYHGRPLAPPRLDAAPKDPVTHPTERPGGWQNASAGDAQAFNL